MPIYTPNHVVKVSCPDCGWDLLVHRGGFGDCLTGQNTSETLFGWGRAAMKETCS